MSYITISKAAEILGVNKKTLFRWDEDGRFKPTRRETVSKIRLYNEDDIHTLKKVLEHEKRFQKNVKEWKQILNDLTQDKSFLLTDKYIQLSEREEELSERHRKLMDEFKSYSPAIHLMHKKFFKI